MTQIADTLPALEADASPARPSFFERLKSTNWVMAWQYGSFPWLSDLKVSVRVTLLLILALLAATVFGAVSVIGERKVAQAMQAQLSYRALGDLAARVKSDGLKMQVLEQEFLRSRDLAFADAQVDVLSGMAAAVKDMAARPETEAVAGQLKDLSGRLDAHAAQFERVVATERLLGLSANDGLRGALGKSVKAMEDELKMWPNLDPLWNKMLGMRQAEKDFMLYGGDEYLGRFRKFAMEFDLKLDSAGLPASTANEFRGLLDRYKKDMAAFAEGSKTEDQARTQLHDEAAALSPVIDAIFDHAHDRALRSAHEQEQTRAAILFNNQLVGALSLLAFLILSLVLSRTIVKPLRRIEDTMRRLVAGEHSVRVPCTGLGDEIGDMARAVEIFKENALNMVALQREHEGLMVNAETQRKAAMTNLADQFEGQVKTIALSVSTGGTVIADRARAMAMRDHHANESRSMAVVEAAAKSHEAVQAAQEAAQELGESIAEVSRLVDESGKVAAAGEVELGAVETQVVGLADAARHIGSVVDMISQIAHQTNLLALNATIEAARAGAAGKGFAVVAGEVKTLAGQTADATNRIVEQVAAIQAATTDTVATVERIAVTIRRMHEITIAVQGAMNRQGEATARIGSCVAEVSAHSQFVAEGVVAVAHSAATYCGSAIQVLWAANDLSQPVSRLNAEMDGFLGRVRS